MQALVVFAHPDRATSFASAVLESVLAGLDQGGHDVDVLDLYALDFAPAMTADHHRAYEGLAAAPPSDIADHLALIQQADMMIFVFPTWWSGLPAMLKGWLERVMLPGVAFDLDPATGTVKPTLNHIKHLVGVTTYGSPQWYVRALADPGRRTILRTLWLNCGFRTKRHWLPLYGIDSSAPADRADFLERVRSYMAEEFA